MMTLLGAIILFQAASAASQSAPVPAPPVCDSEQHAAFDFWVGEWDVFPHREGAAKVADSRIERLYAGCAVRENWMPLNGTGGGSLNAYEPSTGLWHQFWTGSSPGRVEFIGGPANGAMVLTGYWRDFGGPGQHALVRQTFTAIDSETVRQHGEASTDQGLTWQTRYDFIYRRKEGPGQ